MAATLPLPIQQNSRRRHIQRFLNLTKLSVVILWFPLIKEIMARRISKGKQLIIALDRTQWQENNILMASAIYQKRAFPIFWILLQKKGASDLREQQSVLRPVIKLFRTHKVVIIGDREFHSVDLAQWIHRNLEGSKASPDKLVRIVLLIALAMTTAWLQGERTAVSGKSSYICRPKETGRTKRRHSNFWTGLYGYNWIAAFHECQEWVEELIISIRNKRTFYQRGLKALTQIQQAL